MSEKSYARKYVIETLMEGHWVSDAVGHNPPRSREECEEDIELLRSGTAGEEFTEAEYRVADAL